MSHYAQFVVELTILVLAIFLGIEVISKVPTLLHTPLMSGTNAIHGIVVLGGLLVLGTAGHSTFNKIILFVAIVFGTINVVGGFLVTDRMLEMFKGKPGDKAKAKEQAAKAEDAAASDVAAPTDSTGSAA